MIRPEKKTKLCLCVEKLSRSVKHLFLIFTQSWILLFVSFSYRIRQCFIQFEDSIQCTMCIFVNNQFRTCANAFPNEFTVRSYEYARVNIEFFTGCKKIKQQRISFVLGYLHMILWKISTAINIKHRILAFNKLLIKKKSISDSLYAFKWKKNFLFCRLYFQIFDAKTRIFWGMELFSCIWSFSQILFLE
jgi:hypothetical protein